MYSFFSLPAGIEALKVVVRSAALSWVKWHPWAYALAYTRAAPPTLPCPPLRAASGYMSRLTLPPSRPCNWHLKVTHPPPSKEGLRWKGGRAEHWNHLLTFFGYESWTGRTRPPLPWVGWRFAVICPCWRFSSFRLTACALDLALNHHPAEEHSQCFLSKRILLTQM